MFIEIRILRIAWTEIGSNKDLIAGALPHSALSTYTDANVPIPLTKGVEILVVPSVID
jgi:hypothetical protein